MCTDTQDQYVSKIMIGGCSYRSAISIAIGSLLTMCRKEPLVECYQHSWLMTQSNSQRPDPVHFKEQSTAIRKELTASLETFYSDL